MCILLHRSLFKMFSLAEKAPSHMGRCRASSKPDQLFPPQECRRRRQLAKTSSLGPAPLVPQKRKDQHLDQESELPPVHRRRLPGLQPKFPLSAFQRHDAQDVIQEKTGFAMLDLVLLLETSGGLLQLPRAS